MYHCQKYAGKAITMLEDEEKLIYFIIYRKDRAALTVIDLHPSVSYERDEWDCANDENFGSPEEAIEYCRALAEKHNLEYEPFESRYDSSTNEKIQITL